MRFTVYVVMICIMYYATAVFIDCVRNAHDFVSIRSVCLPEYIHSGATWSVEQLSERKFQVRLHQ